MAAAARGARLLAAVALAVALSAAVSLAGGEKADLILHNGRIVTVDEAFSIRQAVAVRGERILLVGGDEEVLATRGDDTRVIDLGGKMVLPGLIDSHVHATSACMTEFDHPIPEMESIDDVLEYVRSRAEALEDGDWIVVRQVFITRLRERRYPTRTELDRAAPSNPVIYSTGPDASLNSLALAASGIDRDFRITDGKPGSVERDASGEPTGILRSCTRLVKSTSTGGRASEEDRGRRLRELIHDYNSVGLTTVADRNASSSAVRLYRGLLERGELTTRVFLSRSIDAQKPIERVVEDIRAVAAAPLFTDRDTRLFIGGVKVFLDGGMLTGSAYMRKPWGVSEIYSIDDPEYRGHRFIPHDRLVRMARAAVESGLQFTAHAVGDGAVHALLDAYEEIDRDVRVAPSRPCITHSNFMSREAIEKMVALGVVADIQPAWLWLDTSTLVRQFGLERLRYFQPLRSIFELGAVAGGGSDHMQKIGSLRAVNPYNPFLGMWVTITRCARWYDGRLHPEEALSREQALRFYTRNNAYVLRLEREVGSIEKGKLADLIVIDRDLLSCPLEALRETRVLATYLGGRRVFSRE